MINICLILKVANVSINVINVFIIIYGAGGGGICVFGLVDEKRQQNLTVITRKAYKGTLNQEIYIVRTRTIHFVTNSFHEIHAEEDCTLQLQSSDVS